MKKKLLSFLLLPLILTSCSGAGVSLEQVRAKLDTLEEKIEYPYYKVVGSADFNNVLYDVDADFVNEPGMETFVPYSRYNNGFYNPNVDISEPNIDNIVIYSLASKSYWLRAPLRITKSNFYSEVYTISSASLNDEAITINNLNYEIGTLTLKGENGEDKLYQGAKIASASENALVLSAELVKEGQDPTKEEITFNREGQADETFLYAGEFKNGKNELKILKGSRENTTCAHYLIQHIITSYLGQTGSTNPSKNQMKMEIKDDGGFVFYGEEVHSIVYIDNLPYYPDPAEHPEVGEWDPEYPIPCYKNKINVKSNIRFEYDKDGWLVKESLQTVGYDYNVSSVSQCSLVAVYGYKFN